MLDERQLTDIEKALRRFSSSAYPSNPSGSEPATTKDVQNLADETAKFIMSVIKAIKD